MRSAHPSLVWALSLLACGTVAPSPPEVRAPEAPIEAATILAPSPVVPAGSVEARSALLTASPAAAVAVGASATPVTPIALDEALLAAARGHQAEFQRDLATLVSIDSGTDDAPGLARVAAWLKARLKALGAETVVSPAPPSAGPLVRATFHGKGRKRLLLLAHFDTVFGHGEAAKRPFRIEGGRAFGPGVADAKGGVALVLHALALAKARGFVDYQSLTVLFNPDEEKGSFGSRELIRSLSAEADAVLSYEPPDGERVIVATNGIAFVELDVKGRAAHAGAAPEKGRNASLELAGQIMQLRDLGDARKGTTVNWTLLKGGDRANIIPEHAHATADMRLSDPSEAERVQSDANRIIEKHFIPDTQVTVTVDPRRPPFARNPASEGLALLARQIYLGLERPLEAVAMRYGTDAGFAYHPGSAKPAVLEGLGIVGDGLHSPEEWADLASVPPRLYLTVRLLETLARGAPDSTRPAGD